MPPNPEEPCEKPPLNPPLLTAKVELPPENPRLNVLAPKDCRPKLAELRMMKAWLEAKPTDRVCAKPRVLAPKNAAEWANPPLKLWKCAFADHTQPQLGRY